MNIIDDSRGGDDDAADDIPAGRPGPVTIFPPAHDARADTVRLLVWADQRLQEKSTIAGIATVVAAAGYSTLAAGITSHADLICMAAGLIGSGLIAASTTPRQPGAPASPASPHPPANASSAISMEKPDMPSIIVEIEQDVLTFLKSAGKAVETFVLSEGQKLVAEVKQTHVGTVALNVIQALESHAMSGAEKFAAVLSAVVPLIEKLIASGGISMAIASVTDFAREFVQSAYNDFKADIARVAGTAQAAA